MIVIYFRFTGMPYKSQQHYDNLKHIGLVSAYWSFAFILKFITASINDLQPGLSNIDKSKDKSDNSLFLAISYFALSLLTDIVPFMVVADTQFIKIFSYELIKKFNRDQNKDNDIENVLRLQGQEDNLANIANNGLGNGELKQEIERF
jgi:hypothetical protein